MNFLAYQEGYMQHLERLRREREEQRRNAPKPKTLSEQITEWKDSLLPAEQVAIFRNLNKHRVIIWT